MMRLRAGNEYTPLSNRHLFTDSVALTFTQSVSPSLSRSVSNHPPCDTQKFDMLIDTSLASLAYHFALHQPPLPISLWADLWAPL